MGGYETTTANCHLQGHRRTVCMEPEAGICKVPQGEQLQFVDICYMLQSFRYTSNADLLLILENLVNH